MLVTYFRMTNLYTWIFTLDRTSKLATLSSTVVFVPRRLNNIFVAVYLPGCRHKRTLLLHCMHRPAPGEDRNPGCYSVHNLLSNYDKHVGVTDLRFSKWKKRDNQQNHRHRPTDSIQNVSLAIYDFLNSSRETHIPNLF